MMLSNGDKIGPYTIRASAGQGGMATVYQAWHEGLHRMEALKVPKGAGGSDPDSAFILRLLTEARVAAGLHHPNIVGIHGVSEPFAPIPYFAMDWVEGRDLAKILAEKRAFSLDETVALLENVATALDYAHRKGVVHRDIKPANILVTENEGGLVPHVVDFGISRAAEDEDGATKLTKSGMIVGTPEYMSPEQAGSGEPVDFRTDIYSLAVVAYEMLCGCPPFTAGSGVSRLSILISHVRDIAPLFQRLPEFPKPAGDVLLRALSKSPASRPQSCAAFIAELKAAAGSDSRIFATEEACERTPFDSSRFQVADDATMYERPGASTVPAPVGGVDTLLNGREGNYSLQARLGNAVVEEPVPVVPHRPTPEPKVPAAAVFAQSVAAPFVKPVPRTSSRIALMAGVGGVVVGAMLMTTFSNWNVQQEMARHASPRTKVVSPPKVETLSPAVKSTVNPVVKPAVKVVPVKPQAGVGPATKTSNETLTRAIAFTTEVRRSSSRAQGSSYVEQSGQAGVREVTFVVTRRGSQEMARKIVSQRVTKQPVPRIVVVGTRRAIVEPAPRPRPARVRPKPRSKAIERRVVRAVKPKPRNTAPRRHRPVREAPLPP